MIVGGAAIGFYLALQAGAGPYQWLLSLAGLLLGASCGVVVMVLQRKFHQASLQVIVSGIIGFVLGLGYAKKLIADMAAVRELAAAGLAKRAEVGIKVRQPLAALIIKNKSLKL